MEILKKGFGVILNLKFSQFLGNKTYDIKIGNMWNLYNKNNIYLRIPTGFYCPEKYLKRILDNTYLTIFLKKNAKELLHRMLFLIILSSTL